MEAYNRDKVVDLLTQLNQLQQDQHSAQSNLFKIEDEIIKVKQQVKDTINESEFNNYIDKFVKIFYLENGQPKNITYAYISDIEVRMFEEILLKGVFFTYDDNSLFVGKVITEKSIYVNSKVGSYEIEGITDAEFYLEYDAYMQKTRDNVMSITKSK